MTEDYNLFKRLIEKFVSKSKKKCCVKNTRACYHSEYDSSYIAVS